MQRLEEEETDEELFPGQLKEEAKGGATATNTTSTKAGDVESSTTTAKPPNPEEVFPGQIEEEARIAALLASDPGTLSEPLWRTIWRDVFSVFWKLLHILFPFSAFLTRRHQELRNWDLWGPLVFSFVLAIVVAQGTRADQALVFTATMTVLWAGGIIVSVNSILLGGRMSLFSSVCVMGYCLAPLDGAAIACLFWDDFVFRLAVVGGAYLWAIIASWGFIQAMIPSDKAGRGFLVSYPVFLFYLFVAWVILVSNDV